MITNDLRQIASLSSHPGWPILLEKLRRIEADALADLEKPASREAEASLLAKWRGIREVNASIRTLAEDAQNALNEMA